MEIVEVVKQGKERMFPLSASMTYCILTISRGKCLALTLSDHETGEFLLSAVTDLNESGDILLTTLPNASLRCVQDIPISCCSSSYFGRLVRSNFGLVFNAFDTIGTLVAHIEFQMQVLRKRPVFFSLTLFHTQRQLSTAERSGKLNEGVTYAPNTTLFEETVLRTRRPLWNTELGCWQHNLGTRVKAASNVNFVVIQEPETVDVALTSRQCNQPISEQIEVKKLDVEVVRSSLETSNGFERVVLRHGKLSQDTYVVDFRQPLSGVIALAVICAVHAKKQLVCT